ncbi:MAG TPA: hypothetical protein VJJ83_02150 [Candidatus Babeliales bacterium]|nr:hypothetical protein [Candidatus Babeliales bacterium]
MILMISSSSVWSFDGATTVGEVSPCSLTEPLSDRPGAVPTLSNLRSDSSVSSADTTATLRPMTPLPAAPGPLLPIDSAPSFDASILTLDQPANVLQIAHLYAKLFQQERDKNRALEARLRVVEASSATAGGQVFVPVTKEEEHAYYQALLEAKDAELAKLRKGLNALRAAQLLSLKSGGTLSTAGVSRETREVAIQVDQLGIANQRRSRVAADFAQRVVVTPASCGVAPRPVAGTLRRGRSDSVSDLTPLTLSKPPFHPHTRALAVDDSLARAHRSPSLSVLVAKFGQQIAAD